MKQIIAEVNSWISIFVDLLLGLIVIGVTVGILFNDPFNVIQGIGVIMGNIGDNGLAGLVALILVVIWYKK